MKDELFYEKMNPPGVGALVFILLGALPTGAVLLLLFGEQPVTAPVPLIVVLLALGGLFWALIEGAGTRVYADRIEYDQEGAEAVAEELAAGGRHEFLIGAVSRAWAGSPVQLVTPSVKVIREEQEQTQPRTKKGVVGLNGPPRGLRQTLYTALSGSGRYATAQEEAS